MKSSNDGDILSYPSAGVEAIILKKIASTRNNQTDIMKIFLEGEIYIMKIMKKTLFKSKGAVSHVFNEKKILGLLDHQSMPKLLKTCQDSKTLCLIMTLKQGAPLHTILQMNQKFPPKLAKQLIFQVIEFLEYLHENGIIYRDLKASNLLLDENGKLKLVDFGLSKIIKKQRLVSL